MQPSRFDVVFEKLAEEFAADRPSRLQTREVDPRELDEIDELRRLCLEFAEPELQSDTLT
jgi:hypothetical protein